MSKPLDVDDPSRGPPGEEDDGASADLEFGSAGNRLFNSLMAAMTFGALASLVMAIGRALR